MRTRWIRSAALLAIAGSSLVAAPQAMATFAGSPGKVAFGRSGPGLSSQLWISGRKGPAKQLTLPAQFSFATSPDFSRSGNAIAFTGALNGQETQVFTIHPDGSGLKQITGNGGIQPAFSPNSRFVLFADAKQPGAKVGIWRMPTAGGAPHLLVAGIAGNGDFNPAISPNGRIFAFESGGKIFTARIDGSHVKRLAGGRYPDFSPNGRLVSFAAKSGKGEKLVVRAPGGGQNRTIYDPPGNGDLFYPAFSPDGKTLSFMRTARARNAFLVRAQGRPSPTRLFGADSSGFFYDAPAIQPR